MRIDSSIIGMESTRRYTSFASKATSYRLMDYKEAAAKGTRDSFGNLFETESEQTEVGYSLEDLQQRMKTNSTTNVSLRSNATSLESFRHLTLRYIFHLMFGKEKTDQLFDEDSTTDTLTQPTLSSGEVSSGQVLVYSNQVSFYEMEETSFSSTGTVKTSDGREIDFQVDVTMSREFSAYYEENFGVANIQTCDPLVLNFEGDVAGLSDQKFYFDLDGDGSEDEISMLEKGSGYLALDKNQDGLINDGSELFGPKSGNGFGDLAAYDGDGNGWIDENDAIWSKLKIWCKTESGEDKLYTLGEKGVGAICLQNADTNFTLRGQNNTNGYIRKTGVFLYENGNVGTMQHVDLTKESMLAKA